MKIRYLIEAIARIFIVVFFIGMIYTVYSNYNPVTLEYVWTLRFMSLILIFWIAIPLADFMISLNFNKKKKDINKIERR